MTAIRTESVPLVDGTALQLSVAEPVGAVRGGIVVLHEARGVTAAVREMVEGLAGDGWLTVAPHLYHGTVDDEPAADAELAATLTGAQIVADSDTAFAYLADREVSVDRMGVIGFDLGGVAALLVAAQRRLGAAVTLASTTPPSEVTSLVAAAKGLTCPWLGVFGENDDGTTDPEIERLRDAAESSEVATNVVVYPRRAQRFEADPDVAPDVWERVLNWFDSNLR